MDHQWPLALLSLGGLGALAFCALWERIFRPRHFHIFHWKKGCPLCEEERWEQEHGKPIWEKPGRYDSEEQHED